MRKLTYSQSICEALREEMLRDGTVFIMGEDVGLHGGVFRTSVGLFQEFGAKRVKDTPISEGSFVGAAVGAAITGLRPVVEIMYIDFITLALDQIVNQAAKIRYMFGGKAKVPLVIRTQGGAGKGNAAHHSQSFEAWFMHVPGLKVVMPSTPFDAKGLLKTAIRDDNPIIFIEHKLLYPTEGEVPEEEYTIPLGKADVKKEGKDITLLTYSFMVYKALAAAEELNKEGISVEVIDLRSLVPLDIDTVIDSVKKTGKVIVVEEDCKRGGVGAEVLAVLMEEAFDHLDAPVRRVAGLDVPIPYCHQLESAVIPDEKRIIKAVHQLL